MRPMIFLIAGVFCCSSFISSHKAFCQEGSNPNVLGVTIPLWEEDPPRYQQGAPLEQVDERGSYSMVSRPTITLYMPSTENMTGMALVICPGGGYGKLDWKTHVLYAAEVFNNRGIAIIGLKYRTRPPFVGSNSDIQELTLLDAQRAIRLIRSRAEEWGLDSNQIGIAGYSAGANLAMNLAANFDLGNSEAPDPVDRLSSRPDFAIGMATWHWRQKQSPFLFSKLTPPIYLLHATNDGISGGAPIELPKQIAKDLEELGVPVFLDIFDQGAHGVGNLIPQRVKNGFPPAQWPDRFLNWYQQLSH